MPTGNVFIADLRFSLTSCSNARKKCLPDHLPIALSADFHPSSCSLYDSTKVLICSLAYYITYNIKKLTGKVKPRRHSPSNMKHCCRSSCSPALIASSALAQAHNLRRLDETDGICKFVSLSASRLSTLHACLSLPAHTRSRSDKNDRTVACAAI